MDRRCTSEVCISTATGRNASLGLSLSQVLENPQKDWKRMTAGRTRVAREVEVDWNAFGQDRHIFSHCTIVASVKTEDNGYHIDPVCSPLVNNNGNAWTNPVLLATFRSFVGGFNFHEHVQIPELSKGKILDAVIRPIRYKNASVGKDALVYYCFAGDTPILMSGGEVRGIADICPGQEVVSGDGSIREVLAISHHYVQLSETVEVSIRGVLDKTVVTSNHGYWAKENIEDEWGWIDAGKLERNWWVLQPKPMVNGTKRVNPDFAWLVGEYVAEGSLVEGRKADGSKFFSLTQFTCHKNERDIIIEAAEKVIGEMGDFEVPFFKSRWDEDVQWVRKCSGSINFRDKGEGSNIRVGHRALASELFRLGGRGAAVKSLDDEILLEWDEESKLNFLAGLIDGDGHARRNVVSLKSSSNSLVRQVEFLLSSLGMAYSTTGNWHDGAYSGCATIELDCYSSARLKPYLRIKNVFEEPPPSVSMNNRASLAVKEGIARRVESVTPMSGEVQIPVYNIEVDENHTYVANNVKVKNCDILVATERRHAQLCRRITSGELNTMSMGCTCSYVQCSKCGVVLGDNDPNCSHIDNEIGREFVDDNGVRRMVAELCGRSLKDEKGVWVGDEDSLKFIEASWVERPAFEGAVMNHFLSEVPKAAAKILEFPTDKLEQTMEELFRTRVADARGMMVLRVAIEEMNRRRREGMSRRVEKMFWS